MSILCYVSLHWYIHRLGTSTAFSNIFKTQVKSNVLLVSAALRSFSLPLIRLTTAESVRWMESGTSFVTPNRRTPLLFRPSFSSKSNLCVKLTWWPEFGGFSSLITSLHTIQACKKRHCLGRNTALVLSLIFIAEVRVGAITLRTPKRNSRFPPFFFNHK